MTRLIDLLGGRTPAPVEDPQRDLGWDTFTTAYFAPSNGTEMVKNEFASYVTDGYQANSIVFSVILARMMLFSEAEFKFRDKRDKRIFTTGDLDVLETPWPGATTGELLCRMEQDVSLAGNSFTRRTPGGWLQRLRPDLVDIISVETADEDYRVVGYNYWPDGRASGESILFDVDEVAHWSPVPDPLARFRGMSWLTPVVREIRSDIAMSDHKESYFRNAASPNMLIRYPNALTPDSAESIQSRVTARHAGPTNAWRTMVIDQGADVTLLGSNMREAAFVDLQAAGENRIAAAAGVPGIVVGLREGLQAATYSNYAQAMRRFADLTMRPLWRSAAASLAKLVMVPAGARLWYDTTDIAALREGETERATTAQVNATAMQILISAGYTPDSVTRAVISGDFALLAHTGLVSVQLQTPGAEPMPAAAPSRALAVRTSEVDDDMVSSREMVELIHLLREDPQAPIVNINVEPTPVTVNVEPTPVSIPVSVEPTPVTVNLDTAPVTVNVEPTPVTVEIAPTPVTVDNHVLVETPPRKTVTSVERDPRGLITKTTATERDA